MNLKNLKNNFWVSFLGIFVVLAILLVLILYFHQRNVAKNSVSGQKLSSNITQNIVPGSKIKGKTNPNSNITLLITPNLVRAQFKSDSSGNYSYTLPYSLPSGTYNLSIIVFDSNNKFDSIKTYPVKITSSSASKK